MLKIERVTGDEFRALSVKSDNAKDALIAWITLAQIESQAETARVLARASVGAIEREDGCE